MATTQGIKLDEATRDRLRALTGKAIKNEKVIHWLNDLANDKTTQCPK